MTDKEIEIVKALLDNAPDTYSGSNIERNQKKMFAFMRAREQATELVEPILSDEDKRLEPILQKLKDLRVIKSWYYNGTYHAS